MHATVFAVACALKGRIMPSLPEHADVWVLAGQSNMAGSGAGEPYAAPSPDVWLFNLQDEWQIAEEPFALRRFEATDEAFALMRSDFRKSQEDPGYWARRKAEFPAQLLASNGQSGLGLPFGKALSAWTGRPVGLIYCAKGDTRMSEWRPDYDGHPHMALYAATIRRIRAVGRRLAGILWYQGESDTFDDKGKAYAAEMRKLVAAFRRDTGQSDLPFLYVQIAACVMQTEEELPDWNLVQETQRRLQPELAPGDYVAAIDLPLCDGIHLATRSLARLGVRLAKLARCTVYGDGSLQPGPRPVAVARDPRDDARVLVRYAGVNGSLAPARAAGYSIHAPGSTRNLACVAEVIAPDTVAVRAYLPIPEGSVLWYGKGLMPFCNLADSEDLAAPVFGPWAIPRQDR
jgi:sialate O-acetylesterase